MSLKSKMYIYLLCLCLFLLTLGYCSVIKYKLEQGHGGGITGPTGLYND